MNHDFDLIVVGGGPAGMMAAGVAARNGKTVLILEKNEKLGEKLKISGGGRCNITNATYDIRDLLKVYGDAEQFLYSPFSQFGVQSTFDFFESHGLPLVIEARNRAFPKTQRAMDVFLVMEKFITHKNITIKTSSPVKKIAHAAGKITSVETRKDSYTGNHYIIAVGGTSHSETGSTGDGFAWLKELGHDIQNPTPSIVPLRSPDKWIHDLSGNTLSFMKITFFVNKKKAFSKTGKILFTHFGISGPLILNSASSVSDLLHEGDVTATIDCYPDTDLGALEKSILKVFDQNKNRSFKNVLKYIVPEGMANAIIEFHIIPNIEDKVHSISKEHRKELVRLLKAMPLSISGLMDMSRAVVSDGGVPLSEIDTKTMRSKVVDNLSVIGDVLHINRPSGGYSLQLCWTTGFVAGNAISSK